MSKLFTAIGLMSGTSLDGIDVALIETDGEDHVRHGTSETYAYSQEQQQMLRQGLADALAIRERNDRPGTLAQLEQQLTRWHAEAVKRFLQQHGLKPREIDLAGFHGQTVLHRPEDRLTVQLGNGKQLAREIGISVVHDMRAADVAAGGQGAPLVPVYHRALASRFRERPLAFINIGGVSNITWVGEDDGLIAFDAGPGNALLNDWAMRHTGQAHDLDGRLAAKGEVNNDFIARAMQSEYFRKEPPKSLDRNDFQHLSLDGLSVEDGAATLVELTKQCIVKAVERLPSAPRLFVVCGGGRHNPAIMKSLRDSSYFFSTAEDEGLDGDAIEAEAWAYLAVRSKLGLDLTYPMTTGVEEPMTGGVLALL